MRGIRTRLALALVFLVAITVTAIGVGTYVFVEAQQSGIPYQGMACETSFWMQLLFGAEFAEGACMPKCVPEVDDAPLTEQGDCADGFKCVPCTSPTSGQSTGACEPQG